MGFWTYLGKQDKTIGLNGPARYLSCSVFDKELMQPEQLKSRSKLHLCPLHRDAALALVYPGRCVWPDQLAVQGGEERMLTRSANAFLHEISLPPDT